MDRRAFLSQPAPPGYVAGLGRGATGFTTRSDIGPSRPGFDEEDESGVPSEDGLLGLKSTQKEDIEADEIFASIEQRLRKKKKPNPKKNTADELPDPSSHFTDLKPELATVSAAEWLALPEAGDMTRRNKREREIEQNNRRTYNVSDALITGLQNKTKMDTSVNVLDAETDFSTISKARERNLALKLDSLASQMVQERKSAENTIFPEASDAELSDISKSRAIFRSLCNTEPHNAQHWIAAAQVEVQARRFEAARTLALEGTKRAPKSPEIWLEAANLHASMPQKAKIIVSQALNAIPTSPELWKKSIDLQQDVFSKKRLVQQALQRCPDDEALWRIAVSFESNNDEAKRLLDVAVSAVPFSLDLWLALANHEKDSKKKKDVLNRARKAIPGAPEIWIAALRAEEADGPELSRLSAMASKAVRAVSKPKDVWLEALGTEPSKTTIAIVEAVIRVETELLNHLDRLLIWKSDAEVLLEKCYPHAKVVYECILTEYPTEIPVWRQYLAFLKKHDRKSVYDAYKDALAKNPDSEELWLRYAKDLWKDGDSDKAREALRTRISHNSTLLTCWSALAKLERESGFGDRAVAVLKEARQAIPKDPRFWYKGVAVYREQDKRQEATELVEEGLNLFPHEPKLYMQKGQILSDGGDETGAIDAFRKGVKACEKNVALWILLSRSYEKSGQFVKARSVLERAVVTISNPELYAERAGLERRAGNLSEADQAVLQGLKLYPNSAEVWMERLRGVRKRSERKKELMAALKATQHPGIIVEIGRGFYLEGNYEKAKAWFERGIEKDEEWGDAWAWLYWANKKGGLEADSVVKRVEECEPKRGWTWTKLRKEGPWRGWKGILEEWAKIEKV